MPKSPNNLQFSLSAEYLEKLSSQCLEGESLGLTAKRLIIQFLDGDIESDNLLRQENFNETLEEIKLLQERVTGLEENFQTIASDRMETPKKSYPNSSEVGDDLTSAQLARHLGVSRSSVCRWKDKGVSPDGLWIFDAVSSKWTRK